MRGEERPDEVDELMRQLGVDPRPPAKPAPVPASAPEIPPGPSPAAPSPVAPAGAEFQPLTPPSSPSPPPAAGGLELLGDVGVRLRVELGRARLSVQDVLRLGPGSVVPLESLTADPVNLYVNDCLVARGEVLVVNDNFAVRITEVVPPSGPSGPAGT